MKTGQNQERQGRPHGRPSDFDSQVECTLRVILAISQYIQELGSIPSGYLYARIMGHISIHDYQYVITTLIRAGLVREHPSHLLEWIGPSGPTATNNSRKEQQL